MTICIATNNFPPQTGGIATYYSHLSALLIKHRHRVIVLTVDENNKESKDDEVVTKNGVITVTLKKKYPKYRKSYQRYFSPGGLDAASWIAMGLSMKDWLSENCRSFSIDIIDVPDFGGLAAFLVAESLPAIVITGHGSYTQISRYNYVKNDSHTRMIKQLEKIAFQRADAVIANNPLNQSDLGSLFNKTVEFSTIPYRKPTMVGVINGSDSALVVGWLQKIKGALTTAEAIKQCTFQNKNIKLRWVGGDSYTAPGASKMSSFLQSSYSELWNQNFFWLDEKPNDEVQELIKNASLIIIPSEWETFNYVALEAASLHKPIIVTGTTGASYLFTHRHDAWIIPANDPGSLADAIMHLLNHPELREAIGDNAALMVNEVFNEKSIVEERIKIYQRAINNRQSVSGAENETLSLLKKIKTPQRKFYFTLRSTLKKFTGRN